MSALQISYRISLRTTLHQDLHLHPYKIQVVQEPDYSQKVMFCDEILIDKNQVRNFSDLLIMSDEGHIYFSSHVKKQNMPYWSAYNLKGNPILSLYKTLK